MKITAGIVVGLALVLSLAQAGHAQDESAGAQAETTDEAQTPDARIEGALATALEAGIPVSLLESKIAEGKAKGVAMDHIAAAVEARMNGLMQASRALKEAQIESVTEADLAVAADAIQAGVNASTVLEMARSAPGERRAVAIAVLADLVQLGLASESALARVNAAIAKGPSALANLRAKAAASLRARGPGTGVDIGVGLGLGVGRDKPDN